MAAPRFNAASLGHRETHWIAPEDLIIDEKLNGRFEPHTKQDVIDRAMDMVINGQLAAIGIRRNEAHDGKAQTVYGFLRSKAGLYINEVFLPAGGFEFEGKHYAVTKPFKLWAVQVPKGNDLDALRLNILENARSKRTSVMDMVKNQQSYLSQNGENYDEVAALYPGQTPSSIRRYAQLLTLPRELQLMIHRGNMSADAGFALIGLEETEMKKTVADAIAEVEKTGGQSLYQNSETEFMHHVPSEDRTNPNFRQGRLLPGDEATGAAPQSNGKANGKANGKGGKQMKLSSVIKDKARQKKQEMGKKGPPLTMKNVRDFFLDLDVPGMDEGIRDFAKSVTKWVRGDLTETQMKNAINKIRDDKTKRQTVAEAAANTL